jgi:hypothetical protein
MLLNLAYTLPFIFFTCKSCAQPGNASRPISLNPDDTAGRGCTIT